MENLRFRQTPAEKMTKSNTNNRTVKSDRTGSYDQEGVKIKVIRFLWVLFEVKREKLAYKVEKGEIEPEAAEVAVVA